MTRKQAIREAKRLARTRMNKKWHVIYNKEYAEIYGKENAYDICSPNDFDRFYIDTIPVFST